MNRRGWLVGAAALFLGACEKIARSERVLNIFAGAEDLNRHAQRLVTGRNALAREFDKADISRHFRANGSINPPDEDYKAMVAEGFANWRLVIDGLVETPLSLSLEDLRAESARTQITRHDCVEGWSSIGEWTGAKLAPLLEKAGLKPQAKYLVFHCADTLEAGANDGRAGKYYESIDLIDAFHEQSILAYEMNGEALPVRHGAPVRLRVERQLGYKMAKYVMRIEALDDFTHLGRGKGGFWEDRGYQWYAGI